MGHTYSHLLVHFIFSTKGRSRFIRGEMRERLHEYLGGIAREVGGKALAIGGTDDHVHLLVDLPANRSPAEVARLFKTNSSKWIHQKWPSHRSFAWQIGYGAFSVSRSKRNHVSRYIAGQEEHHKTVSFKEEFREFLGRHGMADDVPGDGDPAG